MQKKRADGVIQKNDYVELMGKIPESLKRAPKPIYGTVLKVKGGIATVKPRYRRFELEIPVKDLKDVPYEKFHRKQKPKKKSDKKPVTKVTVEGDGPVKVIPKPDAKPTFPEIVEEKIAAGNEAVATPVAPLHEKPAAPFTTSQSEPIVPSPAPSDAEDAEPCPTKEELFEANPDPMDPIEELTKEGNKMTYVVITVLLIAAAVGSYFVFFK